MKLLIKMLVIICCLLFSISAKAKTYTNDEMKISMWMPDEMEVITNQKVVSGDNNGWFVKAEYLGLNLKLEMGYFCNAENQEFNDLIYTEKYLKLAERTQKLFDTEIVSYYRNPVFRHYYATIFRFARNNDGMSGEMLTTVHGKMITLHCYGRKKYYDTAKRILDSFVCTEEEK